MWRKAPACFIHHQILTHPFSLCRLSWGDPCFLQSLFWTCGLCFVPPWAIRPHKLCCCHPSLPLLPFPHFLYQEDRGIILSLSLFPSTSSLQMQVSLPGGRSLSHWDANLSLYYLGHFPVMRYIKCHLVLASNVKTSQELPAFVCFHSFTCLSAQQYPSLILSLKVCFFLLLFFSASWGIDVPFNSGLSFKTCFCKCPLPQLYSRKEENKKNFLSIPDVVRIPGGKYACPHLNKWKKKTWDDRRGLGDTGPRPGKERQPALEYLRLGISKPENTSFFTSQPTPPKVGGITFLRQ